MLEYSPLLGALIYLIGTIPYIRDTLSGRTRPNRVTFALWAIVPLISVTAAYFNGVRWAVLPVFIIGLSPALILLASFYNKNAVWKTQPFDFVCGTAALLALLLWGVTHQANVAIFFSILADFLAALPTLRKAWAHPETETATTYVASLANVLTAFLATKEYSFSACAFPVYWTLLCTAILYALWRKKMAEFFKRKN